MKHLFSKTLQKFEFWKTASHLVMILYASVEVVCWRGRHGKSHWPLRTYRKTACLTEPE